MFNKGKNTALKRIIALPVLAFPILVLGPELYGATVLLIILFIGAYLVVGFGINPLRNSDIKTVLLITSAYFVSLVLSILISGNFGYLFELSRAEYFFALAPLIALALYHSELRLSTVLSAIKISLILMGIWILIKSTQIESLGLTRVLWASHLGSILLMFSWVNLNQERPAELFLTALSSALAINAIVLCGTRAPLVNLLLLGPIVIYLQNRVGRNTIRSSAFGGFLVFFLVFSLIQHGTVLNRILNGFVYLQYYSNSDSETVDLLQLSSASLRLEIWMGGLKAFLDKPFLGYGFGNQAQAALSYMDPSVWRNFEKHNHLHNQYLDTLVHGGILAGSFFGYVLLRPLILFCRRFLNGENPQAQILGATLICSYGILGIFDIMLGGIYENTFFVFFLSYFLTFKSNDH